VVKDLGSLLAGGKFTSLFVTSKSFLGPPNRLSKGHLRLHLQGLNYGFATNICLVLKLRIRGVLPELLVHFRGVAHVHTPKITF